MSEQREGDEEQQRQLGIETAPARLGVAGAVNSRGGHGLAVMRGADAGSLWQLREIDDGLGSAWLGTRRCSSGGDGR